MTAKSLSECFPFIQAKSEPDEKSGFTASFRMADVQEVICNLLTRNIAALRVRQLHTSPLDSAQPYASRRVNLYRIRWEREDAIAHPAPNMAMRLQYSPHLLQRVVQRLYYEVNFVFGDGQGRG